MKRMTQTDMMADLIRLVIALPEPLVEPFKAWLLATIAYMNAQRAYYGTQEQESEATE
jgi:hypothetical protein